MTPIPEYSLTHWTLVDLDITHYAGKWKQAVHFADGHFTAGSFDWYMCARRFFLELGGGYLAERGGR